MTAHLRPLLFRRTAPDADLLAISSAQLRHVPRTGQCRQIFLAAATCVRAALLSAAGKNSSGSVPRQADVVEPVRVPDTQLRAGIQ